VWGSSTVNQVLADRCLVGIFSPVLPASSIRTRNEITEQTERRQEVCFFPFVSLSVFSLAQNRGASLVLRASPTRGDKSSARRSAQRSRTAHYTLGLFSFFNRRPPVACGVECRDRRRVRNGRRRSQHLYCCDERKAKSRRGQYRASRMSATARAIGAQVAVRPERFRRTFVAAIGAESRQVAEHEGIEHIRLRDYREGSLLAPERLPQRVQQHCGAERFVDDGRRLIVDCH
jgi:hypothetical protein